MRVCQFYHCCAHEECVELVEKRKYDNGIEEFTTDDVAISIVDDCKNLGIETKDKSIHDLVVELLKK